MKRSGPNFVWDFTCPQVRFMDDKKKNCLQRIRFLLHFDNPRHFFLKTANFCLFLFYSVLQGENVHN